MHMYWICIIKRFFFSISYTLTYRNVCVNMLILFLHSFLFPPLHSLVSFSFSFFFFCKAVLLKSNRQCWVVLKFLSIKQIKFLDRFPYNYAQILSRTAFLLLPSRFLWVMTNFVIISGIFVQCNILLKEVYRGSQSIVVVVFFLPAGAGNKSPFMQELLTIAQIVHTEDKYTNIGA